MFVGSSSLWSSRASPHPWKPIGRSSIGRPTDHVRVTERELFVLETTLLDRGRGLDPCSRVPEPGTFWREGSNALAHRRGSHWDRAAWEGLAPARLEGAGLERPGEGVVEGPTRSPVNGASSGGRPIATTVAEAEGGHLRKHVRQQPSTLRVLGGLDPKGQRAHGIACRAPLGGAMASWPPDARSSRLAIDRSLRSGSQRPAPA